MASTWSLQLHTVSFQRRIVGSFGEVRSNLLFNCYGGCKKMEWDCLRIGRFRKCVMRAMGDSVGPDEEGTERDQDSRVVVARSEKKELSRLQNFVGRLEESFISLPPVVVLMKRNSGVSFALGLGIAATFFVILVKGYVARRKMNSRPPGSVADLVRRGQLKSDKRGISTPLKYEDPFNNPMVKISKGNSSVEMCGKVYKLAPVTLTQDQQAIHKKRRSRAYQWKRPTIFLKEGDPVPPDADPDTIRWIPANHPFATTSSEIDEDLAQTNVYQKHGVPFRIKAEHEALQKRLESLQNDQKLGKVVIDPGTAREYERPFKQQVKLEDPNEETPTNGQSGSKPPRPDTDLNSIPRKPAPEETKKP